MFDCVRGRPKFVVKDCGCIDSRAVASIRRKAVYDCTSRFAELSPSSWTLKFVVSNNLMKIVCWPRHHEQRKKTLHSQTPSHQAGSDTPKSATVRKFANSIHQQKCYTRTNTIVRDLIFLFVAAFTHICCESREFFSLRTEYLLIPFMVFAIHLTLSRWIQCRWANPLFCANLNNLW